MNTTKRHISFPSINQFREVISSVNRQFNFVGLDENGEAIYDHNKIKPIITFTSTVKLHGTNFSICFNNIDGLWVQSRSNIIDIKNDNAGAAFFVETNKEVFLDFIKQVETQTGIDLNNNTISIFGGFVGKSIQKGVGIANLEKSVFIFGVKISPFELDKETSAYWVDHSYLRSPEHRIYNISDYEKHSIDIDFNFPQLSQNKLGEITLQIEKCCPVAKEFGFDNTVGEGAVWTADFNGSRLMFKVKGELHSVSKVKTLASVDVEKLNSIKEFVDYAVTENRFKQGLENIFPNGDQ